MEHGLFAVMGFLTVKVPDQDQNDECTLTARESTQENLLPEIPKETITCRTKVDSVAKAFF